jgi:hypothetical protein
VFGSLIGSQIIQAVFALPRFDRLLFWDIERTIVCAFLQNAYVHASGCEPRVAPNPGWSVNVSQRFASAKKVEKKLKKKFINS